MTWAWEIMALRKIQELSSNPINYLTLFLDFSYYALIIPYRLVFNQETGKVELKSNRIQKILCMIVNICWIGCEVNEACRRFIEANYPQHGADDDPFTYFSMFSLLLYTIYFFTVARLIWFKTDSFLRLAECLNGDYFRSAGKEIDTIFGNKLCKTPGRPCPKVKLWVAIAVLPFFLYPCVLILNIIFTTANLVEPYSEYLSKVTVQQVPFLRGSSDTIKISVGIFRRSLQTISRHIITYPEVLLIICAKVMHKTLEDFLHNIEVEQESMTFSEFVEEYDKLREIISHINDVIGGMTVAHTIGSIPYHISSLLQLMHPENPARFIEKVLIFVDRLAFLGIAVDINRKANIIEKWLRNKYQGIQSQLPRFIMVIHDLSGNKISLDGAGYFRVTATFAGTVLSLVLTFTMVFLQFRTAASSSRIVMSYESTVKRQ